VPRRAGVQKLGELEVQIAKRKAIEYIVICSVYITYESSKCEDEEGKHAAHSANMVTQNGADQGP